MQGKLANVFLEKQIPLSFVFVLEGNQFPVYEESNLSPFEEKAAQSLSISICCYEKHFKFSSYKSSSNQSCVLA